MRGETVYVVMEHYKYEGDYLLDICATFEDALDALEFNVDFFSTGRARPQPADLELVTDNDYEHTLFFDTDSYGVSFSISTQEVWNGREQTDGAVS